MIKFPGVHGFVTINPLQVVEIFDLPNGNVMIHLSNGSHREVVQDYEDVLDKLNNILLHK